MPPARLGAFDQRRVPIQPLNAPDPKRTGDCAMPAQPPRKTFCGSPEHAMDRRRFLGGLAGAAAAAAAADMTVLDVLKAPALAAELKTQQKRVILLWLAGGSSQLESW